MKNISMLEKTKKQIELVNFMNMCRNSYYNNNTNLISNKEYDELFDKLLEMEKESGIVLANSPTITVGYEVVSKLDKVKLDHLLLSLGKTTDIYDFISYFHKKEVVIMAKMDGLTCSLYYEDCKFVKAVSRGNGEIGENITNNVRMFSNIPLMIPFKGKLWVDGEAIIDYKTFDMINEREDTQYKNPRNLVSGTVRQLNNEVVAKRCVRFIAWKLYRADLDDENMAHNQHFLNLMMLGELGFEVVPHLLCNNIDEQCEISIKTLQEQCKELYYPIDGMVGMFNDIEYGESLGMTGHHPKHSLAFKFYQERNETTLLDVEWTTSRTGVINPVAILDPVEIDGTTVSRATLNNVSIIKELKLGIGDTVTVIKANQIIPQIVENLTMSDTYEIPVECPTCHSKAIIKKDNDREALYCPNKNCPAVLHDRLVNFCSREGMNILGLSEERLKLFINLGYVTNFCGIYTLYAFKNKIEKLPGFGENSTNKLFSSIDESRKAKLSNILTAIGIPGIGKSSAKSIAKYVLSKEVTIGFECKSSYEKFLMMAYSNYEWYRLPDFGEITSNNINSYVKENMHDLKSLVNVFIVSDDSEDSDTNNILGGKAFCVTGKLHVYVNRDEIVKEIEKNGGKIVSGVTSKTDYLITNDKDSGSSKCKNAIKYGTKIIDENEFISMIRQIKC